MNDTDSIVRAESGGNPTAKNPNSTASGPGQFIDSTWLDVVRQHRPDLANQSDSDLLALKNDPQLASQPQNQALAKDMTAAYATDNRAILSKSGVPVTPGTTYLAHFAGPQGAVKVLQADPSAPVEGLLAPDALKANPFLKGMTAQDLQAWAARKMGAAAPSGPPQPPAAPVPRTQAPIFAGAPPLASAPAAHPSLDPVVQPSQIFAAQQKPIDISGLRAAMAARAPIFANQG